MKAAVLDLIKDEDKSKFTLETLAETCLRYNGDGIPDVDRTFPLPWWRTCGFKLHWSAPVFKRIEDSDPSKQKGYDSWNDPQVETCPNEGCCCSR